MIRQCLVVEIMKYHGGISATNFMLDRTKTHTLCSVEASHVNFF